MKKKVIEAITYWINTTNYDLNDYVNPPSDLSDYDKWLLNEVKKLVKPFNISSKELLENKDLFMGEDTKKGDGSFYTPPIWAKKAYRVLKSHIPNLADYNVWDASCGTGNLDEPFTDCKQLFVSTLFEEDVTTVQDRLPHSYAFQCDFLSKVDHNSIFKDFTYSLPEKLQEVIKNDEPIIFHMNPPYATTGAFNTDVGKYLKSIGEADIGADLLRQFTWRVYDIIEKNNLTNAYISLVGTQSMYILPRWESIVKHQQERSDFIDGFVFKASEFPGINDSVQWGIFYTLWKYRYEPKGERILRPMQKLHFDFKENFDGVIKTTGGVNLDYNRPYIKDFMQPKVLSDVKYIIPCVSYKGDISLNSNGKVKTITTNENILGYSLEKGSFKDITNFLGISVLPSTTNIVAITEDNFDKCVTQFLHNSFYKQEFLSLCSPYKAPLNYGDDLYKVFYANALLFLPFGRKSLQASFRGLKYLNAKRDFYNTMFPLSIEEIKSIATDKVILEDIERTIEAKNLFYLNEIEKYKHLAWDSVLALYEFGLDFLRHSVNGREKHKNNSIKDTAYYNWDSGFRTLRFTTLATNEIEEKYTKLNNAVRDEVREKIPTYFKLLE